jgi:hypothetical protein
MYLKEIVCDDGIWKETSSESCTKSGFVVKGVEPSEITIQG